MPRQRRSVSKDLVRTIAQRLVQLRKARGLSQQELARQLGVSQTNVSAYERGALQVPSDLVVKLAKAFRISADEILGLEPVHRQAPLKDRRFLRRLDVLDRLPRRDKDALLRIIINTAIARGQRVQDAA